MSPDQGSPNRDSSDFRWCGHLERWRHVFGFIPGLPRQPSKGPPELRELRAVLLQEVTTKGGPGTAAHSWGKLTAMDRAEDLFFVIGMVERGALQLLEPLPGDISRSMLQGATQRLQQAVHMLIGARDQALQGHLDWHRQAFWQEIEQLVSAANVLVERRGDAFCEDGLPEVVHPADALGLARGGEEAMARTCTESSTALLLCDATEDFKRIVPSLEGEQRRQSQIGGQIAVHDGTQTEDPQAEARRAAGGECEPSGRLHRAAGGEREPSGTATRQRSRSQSKTCTKTAWSLPGGNLLIPWQMVRAAGDRKPSKPDARQLGTRP